MSHRTLTIVVLAMSVMPLASTAPADVRKVLFDDKLIGIDDVSEYAGQGIPYVPGATIDSPGYLVGTTWYDYQTNGSSGNRVAIDGEGGVHVDWMNRKDGPDGDRWVYYNYRDESGTWLQEGGMQVSVEQGAGYCQLSVFDDGREVLGYHEPLPGSQDWGNRVAVDAIRGQGLFTIFPVPNIVPGYNYSIWPYMTIDRQGRIHIAATERAANPGDPHALIYTRSSDQGMSWTDPVVYDTAMCISAVMTASRVSDKAAIVYTHPVPDGPNEYQASNDMMYIESPDGENWDFTNGKVNITNYSDIPGPRAYTDCDAVYDFDDNLHVVWNALQYQGEGVGTIACSLFHWSQATGTTVVADGFWDSYPGAWNLSLAKMSIGCDDLNHLFVTWTQFNDSDVSSGNFSNGEIYLAYSSDLGATWSNPENLTNTPTPGCGPGECDSDHWSSLDEVVDGHLRILYVEDKDAGGAPQTEGVATENPVRLLEVENPLVGLDDGDVTIPDAFTLGQNYPNPFNASTRIEFELRNAGEVELDIYNIAGEKVGTLFKGYMEAGSHAVAWDAGDSPSGVYFYRLKAGGESAAARMVLLK